MSLRRPKMQIKPKVSLRSATLKASVDNQTKKSVEVKPIGSPVKEHRTVEQTFDAVKSPSTSITTKVIAVIDTENELNNNNESNTFSKEVVPQSEVESDATKTTAVKKIISEDTNQSTETKDKNVSENQNEVKNQSKTENKPKTKTETNRKRKLSRKDQKSDKSIMRMKDLLLYNPPLTEEQKEMREKDTEVSDNTPDIPPTNSDDAEKTETEDNPVKDEDTSGPRVKVGTDGLLILDEESVVVKRRKSEALNETPLLESAGTTSALTNYSSFRTKTKGSSKPRWTENETIRFYSALNTIGTDFTLMADLFFRGKRTRLDLRNKFKKEEKTNKLMIDEALFSPNTFINQISPELDGLLNDLSDSDDDSEDQTISTQQKTTKAKT